MRTVFGSWKYIFKNIWFVLPFAIVPALFLSLSLDFTAIRSLLSAFLSGAPKAGFLQYFNAFSVVRFDLLGAVYSVCAYLAFSFCMALLLPLVEKHMRLGKLTLSGAYSHMGSLLLSAFVIVFLYLFFYEVWAVVLSAVLFAVASVGNVIAVYILDVLAFVVFSFIMLYLATVCYLLFPCKQVTGFGTYNALMYSYRLMSGLRWRLVLSFVMNFLAMSAAVIGFSYLGELAFRLATLVLYLFLFLDFTIRMETVYFEADKLDREDILRSYRELL
ncbi:MAG: hypothetical protein K2N84_04185 [Clostridia bacterium]|nr:hypothetical protein [Clostridia bacterium]